MKKVYYIGDSTVQVNKIDTYPQCGMAQGICWYLRDGVEVVSLAKNGRSTKSFLEEGLFVPAQEGMQPGDLLLIQFGHNDEKTDEARHTDPYGSYQENLRFYINTARERGAHPLLITPIGRRLFDEAGNFRPGSHGQYPQAMRCLGAEMDVPVADLTAITEEFLARLGDEPSKPLFVWPKDNTHLKVDGAIRMAGFLAQELRRIGGVYGEILLEE